MNLLFVCTLNVARSRAAEAICRELVGAAGGAAGAGRCQVRSAGIAGNAVRRLTTRDVLWADVVAVMEAVHRDYVCRHWPEHAGKVRVLGVPDVYGPDEPDLRALLEGRVRALLEELGVGGIRP